MHSQIHMETGQKTDVALSENEFETSTLAPPTWRNDSGLDAAFGRLHNLLQHPPLRLSHQGHRAARTAGPGCATHPMDIVLHC